jgi:hypothetical protein
LSTVAVSFLSKDGSFDPTEKLVVWISPLIFPINSFFLSYSEIKNSLSDEAGLTLSVPPTLFLLEPIKIVMNEGLPKWIFLVL